MVGHRHALAHGVVEDTGPLLSTVLGAGRHRGVLVAVGVGWLTTTAAADRTLLMAWKVRRQEARTQMSTSNVLEHEYIYTHIMDIHISLKTVDSLSTVDDV